jgi:hypothetical protein
MRKHMKKLFEIVCLSTFVATAFYTAEAMSIEEKTNTDDLNINLFETLKAFCDQSISFLGNRYVFHAADVSCNDDNDDAMMLCDITFKLCDITFKALCPCGGTFDRTLSGVLFFQKKKDGNLFIRSAIYGRNPMETFTNNITIRPTQDAKKILCLCASSVISLALCAEQGSNIFKLTCSKCHQPIVHSIENKNGKTTQISQQRHLACGHILCKQCCEQCLEQWDEEEPNKAWICPVCGDCDDYIDAPVATQPFIS